VRLQGEVDAGPTTPNTAFLPYTKIIPLLDNLSARLDAPVLPVIMAWERPGPWVYPDCFPPIGGAESLHEFTQQARQRGWRVGTFCNGTRWVIGHYWSSYNGQDYFDAQGGGRSVCRTHTGAYWPEHWDVDWRPSYTGCVGAPLTRQIAQNYVRQLIDYGLDWIQFFDQNIGVCTFPCFASDHEHPPLPGHWMTQTMWQLIDTFHALADAEAQQRQGERQVIFSVETPANEYYLSRFPICDVRVQPPGHTISPLFRGFIPLYHYLYHEFILMQGGFGVGPDPYHLPIKNAYNWVIGEIPGGVLQPDGQLMNKDSAEVNWAPWQPNIGSHDDALQMLRATTALRRGPAKPFLVFGRMGSPAQVEPITAMRWQYGGRDHELAAIFHAAWQAPDKRLGWVLANWTTTPQSVTLRDARLPTHVQVHVAAQQVETQVRPISNQQLTLELPSVSCLLVETLT
jgi:hypothetical protein